MSQLRSAYTWPRTPLHEDSDPLLKHSNLRRAVGRDSQDGLKAPTIRRAHSPNTTAESEQRLDDDADLSNQSVDQARTSSTSRDDVDDETEGAFQGYLQRATPGFGIHRARSNTSHVQESRMPNTEPIDVPPGYPKLDYLPVILRSYVTIPLACFYFLVMAGMVVASLLLNRETITTIKNVDLYLVARYGPACVAVVSTILFKSMTDQLRRLLPYIQMCDVRGRPPRNNGLTTVGANYWPLLATINTPLTVVLQLLVFITAFLISSKTLLLQVVQQESGWAVIIHKGVLVSLIAYYAVVGLFTLFITCWLWRRDTGLREGWDPQSFSDIVNLFFWFDGDMTAVCSDARAMRGYLRSTSFRIGYWKRTGGGESKTIYGILPLVTEEVSPASQADAEDTRSVEDHEDSHPVTEEPKRLYQYSPLLSKPVMIIQAFVMGTILGLLLYTWIHGTVASGFAIQHWHVLPSNTTVSSTTGNLTISGPDDQDVFWFDSAKANHLLLASFVVRTLPIFMIGWSLNALVTFDAHFRYMQPIYNMSQGPQKASESILLSYLTMSVLGVTQEAFVRGHWKVFVYSILSALTTTLQLIPWGVITLTETDDNVLIGEFSIPSYLGTIVLIVGYLIACFVAWPCDRRKGPRRSASLIDTWALCHNSHFSTHSEMGKCEPKWTQESLAATIHLRQDRYLLGMCHGVDGKDGVGFDICFDGTAMAATGYVERVAHRPSWSRPFQGLRRRRQKNETDIELPDYRAD